MENSKQPELPAVTVSWNPQTCQVGLVFRNEDFKTWDFLLAVLHMAVLKAEDARKVAQMNAMEKQMRAAQEDRAIRGQILRG